MKKSLLAVAVAAALPSMAFAQAGNSVTISGFVKLGGAYNNYSSQSVGNIPSTNGWGLMEGSSRIIFSGVEDLGNGNAAIWQLDQRFKPDNSTALGATTASPIGNGNTFVGFKGNWGMFRAGRLDLYYADWTDSVGSDATSLQHWNCTILCYVGGQTNLIANGSRTNNVIAYESLSYNGFYGKAAYSFSPLQPIEYQAGTYPVDKKGGGGYLNFGYAQGPITAGLSYWYAQTPTSNSTTVINTWPTATPQGIANSQQEAWRAGGAYNFGMVKVGFTWDQSSYKDAITGSFLKSKRDAWSIPVSAPIGPGTLYFTYTSANKVKKNGADVNDSGAQQIVLGYNYPVSKRTAIGASFSAVRNDTNASYGMFTGVALGDTANPKPGQNVSSFYLGVKHAF